MIDHDKTTVRLESGQLAQMEDGGTVRVIAPAQFHYRMSVSSYKTPSTLEARSDTYEALFQFLTQLEALDYLLLNIERMEGTIPTLG